MPRRSKRSIAAVRGHARRHAGVAAGDGLVALPGQMENIVLPSVQVDVNQRTSTPLSSPPRKVARLCKSTGDSSQTPMVEQLPPGGTGTRHSVRKWPSSQHTGKQCKSVFPEDLSKKKFAVVIGDSHLRSIVDGFVDMPNSDVSLGFMSYPGVKAADLDLEVKHAVVRHVPDMVCILATSNNLSGHSVSQAGVDFRRLLQTAKLRWNHVFVLDFPPRLNVAIGHQNALRDAFKSAANFCGVTYTGMTDLFPLTQSELWCHDNIHLSDSVGQSVFAHAIVMAVENEMQRTAQTAQVSPKKLHSKAAVIPPTPIRTVSPRVIVSREVRVPRSPAVRMSQHPVRPAQSAWVLQQQQKQQLQKDDSPESSIPQNPVWFSPKVLHAMEAFQPSNLNSPAECRGSPKASQASPPKSPRKYLHTAVATPPVFRTLPVRCEVPFGRASRPKSPRKCLRKSRRHSPTLPVRCDMPCAMDEWAAPPSPGPALSCSLELPLSSTEWPPLPSPGHAVSCNLDVPLSSSVVMETECFIHEVHLPGQPPTVIRASSCQGEILDNILDDPNDPNSKRSNSQCTCMALTFLAQQHEGMCFDTPSLDNVLANGDILYKGVITQHKYDNRPVLPYLAIEELPKQVFTESNVYSAVWDNSDIKAGFVKSSACNSERTSERLPYLEESLQCLSEDVTHAILIVAPECFALFRDTSGRYGVFDSHSRSAKGLPQPQGKAILLIFNDLRGLLGHLQKLFEERPLHVMFELLPVSFEIDDGTPGPSTAMSMSAARAATDHVLCETPGPSTYVTSTAAINCCSSDTPVQSTEVTALPAIDCGSSQTPRLSPNDTITAALPKLPVFDLCVKSGRRQDNQSCQAVRASICQQDIVGQHQNKQCTCMALTFLAYHNDGVDFNTPSLDKVLYQGDVLYKDLIQQLQFEQQLQEQCYLLSMEQLLYAKHISTNRNVYSVQLDMAKLKIGPLGKSKGKNLSLVDQLQKTLSQDKVKHALLMVTPECFGVFRDSSGHYGFFDSHSRSADGLSVVGGKAIMLTFHELSALLCHLHQIFKDRPSGVSYELMPVAFEVDNIASTTPAVPTHAQAVPTYTLSKLNISRRRKNRRKIMQQQDECIEQNVPRANKGLRTSNPVQYYKMRYRTPELRLKKLETIRRRRNSDAVYRERLNAYKRERRHNNPEHRQQSLQQNAKREHERLLNNPAYHQQRLREQANSERKRLTHPAYHQQRLREQANSECKRLTHPEYRRQRLDRNANSERKRLSDPKYRRQRLDQKAKSKHERLTDPEYRQRHRQQRAKNQWHRLSDPESRRRHIQRCTEIKKQRLDGDVILRMRHKLQCAMRIKRKSVHIVNRHLQITMEAAMVEAISAFRESVKYGPTYVCTVCHRAMFSNQVLCCNRDNYKKNPSVVTACLTGKYVHTCGSVCSDPCNVAQERRHEYICHCCHNNLNNGKMPSIAAANKLEVAPVPPELQLLNMLERQMIAKFLPFAKIISLPRGRQKAVHGAVICVPSQVETVVNALPRSSNDDQLLHVKLKRHINFKGYQFFYTVNMTNVLAALRELKQTHPEYYDIVINDNASFDRLQDEQSADEDATEETPAAIIDEPQQEPSRAITHDPQVHDQLAPSPSTAVTTDEQQQEELRPGLTFDTCMQPPNIAQEILSYGEGIFSIAPAQGNKPVGIFTVPKLESMAFPGHFPDGQNTLDEVREIKLSPSRYFNARLFCVDTRFAIDQTYLFYAQMAAETRMATNSMSIQVRKGKKYTRDGRVLSNKMLQDKEEVERLVRNKDATRFMQPLRGTPSFWEKALRDLLAMSRQIGRPNWFVTLSAAEMRWPELINIIKAQQGEQGDYSQLDWVAKCEIIRTNPVTLMRIFSHRFDKAIDFLQSPARPIGEVVDYFYRVEFQARGSPHVHMMVWIKDAPTCDDPRVIKFIDTYVSCKMPDQYADPELHKIVSEVQMHSRSHSRSCKKGNVTCRFGFPKLPMDNTIITEPPLPPLDDIKGNNDDEAEKDESIGGQTAQPLSSLHDSKGDDKGKKDENVGGEKCKGQRQKGRRRETKEQMQAKEKLAPLRDMLNDPKASFKDLPDLLGKCNLTAEQYRDNVDNLTTAPTIHLQRHPDECWINPYNPPLLRVWNANMDIQYILDDFSCAHYMMGYVAKPEHEMSQLLTEVVKEVRKSNPNVDKMDEMKHIMHTYVQHREVSAQESVARVCSLPLKKCSRQVIFLQTDEDGLRMSQPMSKLNEMDPDTQDVWMSGIPDKYLNRPQEPEFEDLCMATFASEYRVVYKQPGQNTKALLNDMGFVQKRTKLDRVAIIRYPPFSEQKNPEKFYRRLLKLYLPHREDAQLKSKSCPTYEQFYKNAHVLLGEKKSTQWSVKNIVDKNKAKYENRGKKIDQAVEILQADQPILDAWKNYDADAEDVCLRQQKASDLQEQDAIPDYQVQPNSSRAMPGIDAPELNPDYVRSMYQSLNEMQASIFYTVRQWCWKRVWQQDPDPFFYFISGGAGCGKSHVIKCIYYEATKILRQLPYFLNEADMTQPAVLLAAFTGTAAFNISGRTLHSLLKLPRGMHGPYKSLGNALDGMRGALWTAEILIIDEISMVSNDVFNYVDLRLQQIKGNRKPFGGMSVLAVGDFYQLPPVGSNKTLCNADEAVRGLWAHFVLVELTEIMRQRDDRIFAELLNRLRVKGKADRLSAEDRALLAQACTERDDGPYDVLHIFARNTEVKTHNKKAIKTLGTPIFSVMAQDFYRDRCSGQMNPLAKPNENGTESDLQQTIEVAEGARVMVIRNLDVEDGIVNGTFGTIANIVATTANGCTVVGLLGLRLDSPTAGQNFRRKIQGPTDDLVYIERVEENLANKSLVRRQFPLKLAFGCTTHKVQGMTVSSAVVSMEKMQNSGIAYVALSRTTSLQGLKIRHFDEGKIYANPNINMAMQSMNRASFQVPRPLMHFVQEYSGGPTLTIVHHNTQGLMSHIKDVRAHHELRHADVLLMTETHLSGTSVLTEVELDGYHLVTRNRHMSYTSANTQHIATKKGGGVAVYYRSSLQANPGRFIDNISDLEFAVVRVEAPVKALIATVYRPPRYNDSDFCLNLGRLLDSLALMDCQPIVVCGDFNEDLLKMGRKRVKELFESKGYSQLIATATTQEQTLIDHIYISQPQSCIQKGVLHTYYSYHDAVYCVLTSAVPIME